MRGLQGLQNASNTVCLRVLGVDLTLQGFLSSRLMEQVQLRDQDTQLVIRQLGMLLRIEHHRGGELPLFALLGFKCFARFLREPFDIVFRQMLNDDCDVRFLLRSASAPWG